MSSACLQDRQGHTYFLPFKLCFAFLISQYSLPKRFGFPPHNTAAMFTSDTTLHLLVVCESDHMAHDTHTSMLTAQEKRTHKTADKTAANGC